MNNLSHGSFFSGIGGFDTGAEKAGFQNVFNCEIDKWKRKKLLKLNPNAKQYNDITKISEIEKCTVFSAGFPCQDISINNSKAIGIFGKRSSLFFTLIQHIGNARPDYVLLENSPMLLNRGLYEVLTEFTKIGYMCEWQCLQASDFGYPHKRERIYIIAYPLQKRPRLVFKSLKTFELHTKWTPTKDFVHCTTSRANGFANCESIQRGNIVFEINRRIAAYGDAVMPVIAEYLFSCIKLDIFEK